MFKSVLLVLAGVLLLAPAAISGRNPQAAPAAASGSATPPPAGAVPADMKNPVKPTAASQAHAKQIYSFDCSMCHGDDGKGKTDLATSMALTLPDFTQAASLSGQPDGTLFNVIRNGKDKMPAEEAGRANNDVVWNLVLYVRGFAREGMAAGAPQGSSAAK